MHVSVSWAGKKMNETGWSAQTMQLGGGIIIFKN